jgi:glycosyltransferase involved in cell wall biosynthesis
MAQSLMWRAHGAALRNGAQGRILTGMGRWHELRTTILRSLDFALLIGFSIAARARMLADRETRRRRPLRAGRPLRVLHVLVHPTVGGAERQVLELMQARTQGRVEHAVLVVNPAPHSPFEEAVRAAGIELLALPREASWLERGFPYCGTAARLARFLQERRDEIDLLHPWIFFSRILTGIAGRIAGIPAILARVTGIESETAHLAFDGGREWMRPLDRATVGLPTRIIVESRAAERDFRAWARPRRGALIGIASGIDSRTLEPLEFPERTRLRTEWGASAEGPVVGIVARLSPEKEVGIFLEAVAIAQRRLPDLRAVVVGDGPLRAELEQRASELGLGSTVHFLGFRADARRLMPAFSLLALSSSSESSSSVILEAQMQGVAVVSTAVGGVLDILVDGATGLLVPIGDAPAMGAAFVRVLEDASLRARLAQAGQERVGHMFSAARMVEETEQAYEACFQAEARGRRAFP